MVSLLLVIVYVMSCLFVLVIHYDIMWCVFFFQAEDGIRDLVRSRGLGDVYKRQIFNPIFLKSEI